MTAIHDLIQQGAFHLSAITLMVAGNVRKIVTAAHFKVARPSEQPNGAVRLLVLVATKLFLTIRRFQRAVRYRSQVKERFIRRMRYREAREQIQQQPVPVAMMQPSASNVQIRWSASEREALWPPREGEQDWSVAQKDAA